MAGNIDLDFIKSEIDKSKAAKKKQAISEGHDVPMARDEFLYGLKNAVESGQPNKATAKLGIVSQRSEHIVVEGGQVINKNTQPVNEVVHQQVHATQQPKQQYVQQQNPQQNQNRLDQQADENFYRNLNETKQILGNNPNMGLADSMQKYVSMGSTKSNQSAPITNPNYLIEQVNNAVHTYFQTSNVVSIIEQAVKNTMMEIYQKEKVASALNENKEMIEKIVVDTILALRKRNQAQSSK